MIPSSFQFNCIKNKYGLAVIFESCVWYNDGRPIRFNLPLKDGKYNVMLGSACIPDMPLNGNWRSQSGDLIVQSNQTGTKLHIQPILDRIEIYAGSHFSYLYPNVDMNDINMKLITPQVLELSSSLLEVTSGCGFIEFRIKNNAHLSQIFGCSKISTSPMSRQQMLGCFLIVHRYASTNNVEIYLVYFAKKDDVYQRSDGVFSDLISIKTNHEPPIKSQQLNATLTQPNKFITNDLSKLATITTTEKNQQEYNVVSQTATQNESIIVEGGYHNNNNGLCNNRIDKQYYAGIPFHGTHVKQYTNQYYLNQIKSVKTTSGYRTGESNSTVPLVQLIQSTNLPDINSIGSSPVNKESLLEKKLKMINNGEGTFGEIELLLKRMDNIDIIVKTLINNNSNNTSHMTKLGIDILQIKIDFLKWMGQTNVRLVGDIESIITRIILDSKISDQEKMTLLHRYL